MGYEDIQDPKLQERVLEKAFVSEVQSYYMQRATELEQKGWQTSLLGIGLTSLGIMPMVGWQKVQTRYDENIIMEAYEMYRDEKRMGMKSVAFDDFNATVDRAGDALMVRENDEGIRNMSLKVPYTLHLSPDLIASRGIQVTHSGAPGTFHTINYGSAVSHVDVIRRFEADGTQSLDIRMYGATKD